jgi:hypothetical protein
MGDLYSGVAVPRETITKYVEPEAILLIRA